MRYSLCLDTFLLETALTFSVTSAAIALLLVCTGLERTALALEQALTFRRHSNPVVQPLQSHSYLHTISVFILILLPILSCIKHVDHKKSLLTSRLIHLRFRYVALLWESILFTSSESGNNVSAPWVKTSLCYPWQRSWDVILLCIVNKPIETYSSITTAL